MQRATFSALRSIQASPSSIGSPSQCSRCRVVFMAARIVARQTRNETARRALLLRSPGPLSRSTWRVCALTADGGSRAEAENALCRSRSSGLRRHGRARTFRERADRHVIQKSGGLHVRRTCCSPSTNRLACPFENPGMPLAVVSGTRRGGSRHRTRLRAPRRRRSARPARVSDSASLQVSRRYSASLLAVWPVRESVPQSTANMGPSRGSLSAEWSVRVPALRFEC